jgi:hypothetical protein
MANTIEAKECNLGGLFSPPFLFEIPQYQRPLSWTTENFELLFDDIYESTQTGNQQYFLGSIILQESGTTAGRYEVVDGQQRLTALALLMAVIRDLTDKQELKNSLAKSLFQEADDYKSIPRQVRITPWEHMVDVFNEYVYETGKTMDYLQRIEGEQIRYTDPEDALYHLYEAILVFQARYESHLKDPIVLDRFVKYLMGSVYVVYIKTNQLASAYRLFTVLNTRGVPLGTADLLKSDNLGAIANGDDRKRAADKWQKIEDQLGREGIEQIVAFIRMMHIKEKARHGIFEEYQSQIFDKGLVGRGMPFIQHIADIADIYHDKVLEPEITGTADAQNQYRTLVDLLSRFLPFNDWIPPVLAFYRRFKSDDALIRFILELEKRVIVEWTLGKSLTERIVSLSQVLKLIDDAQNAEEVIPRVVRWEDESATRKTFGDKVADEQFYFLHGGKLARYLLLRLDMELWEMENFGGYPGTITVEHILPQSPAEGSEWRKTFNDDSLLRMTNGIGNLVLLSGRKNSKARNYEFPKKKKAYFEGKTTAFRITREIEDISAWSPDSLRKRQEYLVTMAGKVYFKTTEPNKHAT